MMYTWCLTSTETIRLIRDGEKGVGGDYVPNCYKVTRLSTDHKF